MDVLELKENQIDVDTYLKLRASVGWKKLTRLVGDGAVICYIQDLIVHPLVQGHGAGDMLMERLITRAESMTAEGTELMLDLMCAKGREAFYARHGFIARPTDALGPGMIRYLDKRK